jgi:hypothetical protein
MKKILSISLVVLVIASAYLWITRDSVNGRVMKGEDPTSWNTYTNDVFGVSFEYPQELFDEPMIKKYDVGTSGSSAYDLTLPYKEFGDTSTREFKDGETFKTGLVIRIFNPSAEVGWFEQKESDHKKNGAVYSDINGLKTLVYETDSRKYVGPFHIRSPYAVEFMDMDAFIVKGTDTQRFVSIPDAENRDLFNKILETFSVTK